MIKLKQILTEGNGDCYQAAGRLIMNFFGDKNHKLVHGMVNGQGALSGKRYGHCWVESRNTVLDHSNGRKLEVPTKVYYALLLNIMCKNNNNIEQCFISYLYIFFYKKLRKERIIEERR